MEIALYVVGGVSVMSTILWIRMIIRYNTLVTAINHEFENKPALADTGGCIGF